MAYKIVQWTTDFSDKILSRETIGSYVKSPRFDIMFMNKVTEWNLIFYPKGFDDQNENQNYLAFYLRNKHGYKIDVRMTCSILCEIGSHVLISKSEQSSEETFKHSRCIFGFPKLIKISEVTAKSDLFYPSKKMTFKVEIILMPAKESKDNGRVVGIKADSQVYSDLFDSGKFSDFVLIGSDGEKLKVHRAILAANSPVFAEIFEECSESILRISDFDTKTLSELMRFIYSKNVNPSVMEHLVYDLYRTATKFNVRNLRKICFAHIKKSLNYENVFEIMEFADEIKSERLFQSCIEVMKSQWRLVRSSAAWAKLKPEQTLRIVDCLCEEIATIIL